MHIQSIATAAAILALIGNAATAQSVTRLAPAADRGCSQLEMGAGIPASECGTIALAEVVKRFTSPDGHGDANQ